MRTPRNVLLLAGAIAAGSLFLPVKPQLLQAQEIESPKRLEDCFLKDEELKEIVLIPERYAEQGASFMVYLDNPYVERGDLEYVHKITRKDVNEVGVAYYWILSNNRYALPESAEELVANVRSKKINLSGLLLTIFKFDSEEYAKNFLEKQRQERRDSGIELQKKYFWISIMFNELTTVNQAISYVNFLEAYVRRISPETIINGKENICQEEFFSRVLKLRNFLESSRMSLSAETIRKYVYTLPDHSL